MKLMNYDRIGRAHHGLETFDQFGLLQNEGALSWPFYLEVSSKSVLRFLDLSFYPEKEKDFIQDRLPSMISRAENIGNFCQKNARDKTSRLWNNFIWFNRENHKLIYFPVFKVGSTTMKSYFLYAANYWPDDPEFLKLPQAQKEKLRFSQSHGWRQVTADELFKMPESIDERIRLLRESLRIILVRHPFARILSSYIFRISRSRKDYDERYDVIRKHIVKTYRSKNSKEKSQYPTFREFVRFLIDNEKVIQEDKIDELNSLFMLQSRTIDVCLIDPTIVMKLETFDQDITFLGHLSQIKEWQKMIQFPAHVSHPTSNKNSVIYFGKLSVNEIESLYTIFKNDFESFGYTVKEYLGERYAFIQ